MALHELRHSFLSLAAASGVHPAVMVRGNLERMRRGNGWRYPLPRLN